MLGKMWREMGGISESREVENIARDILEVVLQRWLRVGVELEYIMVDRVRISISMEFISHVYCKDSWISRLTRCVVGV